MAKLSQFLKQKRETIGLTQKEVSDRLGYTTPQFVSNWERGLSSPPLNALAKISDMYKIKPREMIEVVMKEQREVLEKALSKKSRRGA